MSEQYRISVLNAQRCMEVFVDISVPLSVNVIKVITCLSPLPFSRLTVSIVPFVSFPWLTVGRKGFKSMAPM